MADLSQLTLPSGTTYNLKDAWARQKIDDLSSSTEWLGITTTTGISDGVSWLDSGSIKPVTINGASVTPKNGSIIQTNYSGEGSREYILSVTMTGSTISAATWQEFGDLSSLGSLAYKNNASGSVSVPNKATFTGTEATISSTGSVNVPKSGTFTGSYIKLTGSTTIPSTYSTSSSPTNTSTNATITEVSSGNNLQAKGTVSTPTISVKTAGATTSINNPTSKTVVTDMSVAAPASAAANGELAYYEVSGETLTLKKLVETTGASISTSSVTVKTGDAAYQSSQPIFTGQKYLVKYDKTTAISSSTSVATTESAAVAISSGTASSSDNTFRCGGTIALTDESRSVASTASYTPAGSVALTNTSKTVTVS